MMKVIELSIPNNLDYVHCKLHEYFENNSVKYILYKYDTHSKYYIDNNVVIIARKVDVLYHNEHDIILEFEDDAIKYFDDMQRLFVNNQIACCPGNSDFDDLMS